MLVLYYGCFEFCLVVRNDCHTGCYNFEKFYASIEGTFFENKMGWHLVYEGGAYYFYEYCV